MSTISNVGQQVKLLFSWGANSYGQLCNGNKVDVLVPHPAESTYHTAIKLITGGGGHTAIITDDGNLFTAGWNNKGQLGIISDISEVPLLTHIPHISKIRAVACGWNHTLIVNNNGQLYGFGSNQYGQIGIGDNIKKTNSALPVLICEEVIISIAAGLRHSVVATDSGRVWTFGSNKHGQLGHEKNYNTSSLCTPNVVEAFGDTKVTSVAAGSSHSLGISESGAVFCWGSNRHGQCGLSPNSQVCWKPRNMTGLLENVKVIEIFSGWSHILAKTDCGEIFSWGRADYGQLGLGSEIVLEGFCCFPQEITSLRGAIQVSCGSEHNAAINCAGEAVFWGWNEHGICGTGNETNVHEPVAIESFKNMNVHLIGCGGGTTFSVASNLTKENTR